MPAAPSGPNPMVVAASQEMLKSQSALVDRAQQDITQANQNIANANAALNQSLLQQEAEQIKRREADAAVKAEILMNSQRGNVSPFSNMKNFTSLKPLLNISSGSISNRKNTPPANTSATSYTAAVNQPHNQA